jgi:hypothetical protein
VRSVLAMPLASRARLCAVAAARRLATGRTKVASPARAGVVLRWRRERSANRVKPSWRIAQSFSYPSVHVHLALRAAFTMEQRRAAGVLRERIHVVGARSHRGPVSQADFGRGRADSPAVLTSHRRDIRTKSNGPLLGKIAGTDRHARPGRALTKAVPRPATPAAAASTRSGFGRPVRTVTMRSRVVVPRERTQEALELVATPRRERGRDVEPAAPHHRRTPEMVWRTGSRPGSSSPAQEGIVSSETSVAALQAKHSSRPEPAAALAATTLHPQVLDRLAEDVIRRVERRVRIERERRGL